MNKAQFTIKVETFINQLQKPLLDETLRLFESGGVDTQKYGDDFELPKVCLWVALENVRCQVQPVGIQGMREARNLGKF